MTETQPSATEYIKCKEAERNTETLYRSAAELRHTIIIIERTQCAVTSVSMNINSITERSEIKCS